MTDLTLAVLHHILVFGLAIMLAMELALVRPGMSGADVARAARLDAGYGATAGLVILVGVLRVLYGLKGPGYYLDNVWFWAKLVSFGAMALFSLIPTIRFLRWRKAGTANPGFVPTADDIGSVRNLLRLQIVALILIVIFAAAMARFTRF
jgi:putative membrane protein